MNGKLVLEIHLDEYKVCFYLGRCFVGYAWPLILDALSEIQEHIKKPSCDDSDENVGKLV